VKDPDGVEWEVYVLNHDLEDDTPPASPAAAGLRVVAVGACCGPAAS
jgi:hypothetical protein